MKEHRYELLVFLVVLAISAFFIEWKKEQVRESRSKKVESVLSLFVSQGVPVSTIILEPQKFLIEKMVTLKSCKKIYFCANISQKEKKQIRPGQQILNAEDGAKIGNVISVASTRNFNNGLFQILVKVDKKTKQNKIVSRIVTKVKSKVISIPNSSVILKEDGFYVWKVNGDNKTAIRTKIEIGNKSSSLVEITNGLKEGNQIVARGAGQVSKYKKIKIMETKKSSEINVSSI